MPNGKPGDHPLTDFFVHGHEVFPKPIAGLMRQIHALDPHAFVHEDARFQDTWEEGTRRYGDFMAWAEGRGLVEAEAFLQKRLDLAKVMRTTRCPAADYVASEILRAFEAYKPKVMEQRRTYPLEHPNPLFRGVRIEYDLIWLSEGSGQDPLDLSIYTYPEPEIYLLNSQVKRFRSGDAESVKAFLGEITSGKRSLASVEFHYRQIGAWTIESHSLDHEQLPGPELKVQLWQTLPGRE